MQKLKSLFSCVFLFSFLPFYLLHISQVEKSTCCSCSENLISLFSSDSLLSHFLINCSCFGVGSRLDVGGNLTGTIFCNLSSIVITALANPISCLQNDRIGMVSQLPIECSATFRPAIAATAGGYSEMSRSLAD